MSAKEYELVEHLRLSCLRAAQDLATAQDAAMHSDQGALADVLENTHRAVVVALNFAESLINGVNGANDITPPMIVPSRIRELTAQIEELQRQITNTEYLTFLEDAIVEYVSDRQAKAATPPDVLAGTFDMLRDVEISRRIRALQKVTDKAIADVEEAKQDLIAAVAPAVEDQRSRTFQALADREHRTAWLLQLVAVLVLAGVGAIAYDNGVPKTNDLGDLVQHFGYVLPGLLAAGYFARESGQHRRSARWAENLATLLHTIGSYTQDLSAEDRQDLRKVFGRRLFLESNPEGMAASTPNSLNELDTLLQRFIELGLGKPSP